MSSENTLASWIQVILRSLRADDVDPLPLLAKADISEDELRNVNGRIDVDRIGALWRLAEQASPHPAFGLACARHFVPTYFHGLAYAVQSSLTQREALERILRFGRILSTAARLEMDRQPERWRLHIHRLAPVEQVAIEAFVACSLRQAKETTGDLHIIQQVHFARPMPDDPGTWESLLGCPIRFAAEHNMIDYRTDQLDLPRWSGNSELASQQDQALTEYLARIDQQDVAARVRQLLTHRLGDTSLNQETVARELGMSKRNLHRRLSEQGQTFSRLLDSTRHQLALDYLRQPERSLSDIGFSLGFQELSSLNRAVKRWTGMSPSAWRRQQGIG